MCLRRRADGAAEKEAIKDLRCEPRAFLDKLKAFENIADTANFEFTYRLEPEDCYTIGEIAKKFGIHDSTVYLHIRKYSIPTRQIGNYVYAPKSEIDNLYKH